MIWRVLCIALSMAAGLAHGKSNPPPVIANWVDPLVASHPDKSGLLLLEQGFYSLLGRAWLTENATESIDIQYFIWSTDNIGTLAAEALLRAADRGVKVRVLVDDLMIDAEPVTLLSLEAHPNVQIRIYNPVHKVGVSTPKRVWNMLSDFRGFNQRMHDKTLLVDGRVGLTGGRNVADEYYDFDHEYNFRDRDILVLGHSLERMQNNFEQFWQSPLAVPLAEQLADELAEHSEQDTQAYREWLHDYANDPANYTPEIRAMMQRFPELFDDLSAQFSWVDAKFIHDQPGKNGGKQGLKGGGASTQSLRSVLEQAKNDVLIQSPYLVLSDEGLRLFQSLLERGVRIRINTNSMASTDNLEAFSGYLKVRDDLLEMGVEIYEYKPDPMHERELMQRYRDMREQGRMPIFALHAKSMVIDQQWGYVGTFNLDPRSANLNTEVGILFRDQALSQQLRTAIEQDIQAENSWRISEDFNPDNQVPWAKRVKVKALSWLPMTSIL